MTESGGVFIGGAGEQLFLNLKRANRHGLIAGATGTGKTVSLQVLAEGFSTAGVPVFMADVKGDLAGLAQAGTPKDFLFKRAETIGFSDYSFRPFPVVFWDLFGAQGHPVRTTISEMGPLLIGELLDLNDTQKGVLSVAFEIADDEGLLLLDFKDLRSMLNFVGEQASELTTAYGNVSKASVGAIQRRLLELEQQGGEHFFGEPALEITDFIRTTPGGEGFINILAADKLYQSPKLYSTFLLWLLSELFEELPEVGDPEKPRLVFFFDEAHLLFKNAPPALVDKIAQVVRLIRSKGVGVYFVTQNPADVPDEVLGQLGNRVQHALRAFTPRDAKAVKVAAQTFRQNPEFDTADVITQLGVGEALVSTLDGKGVPSVVARTLIRPPSSRMGTLSDAERKAVIAASPIGAIYDTVKDRNSAHEMLGARAAKVAEQRAKEEAAEQAAKNSGARKSRGYQRQGVFESLAKSVARSLGTQLGRELLRGILGSLSRR